MNVAVVGASDDPGRYSSMAIDLLIENGHSPVPVTPSRKEVKGLKTLSRLRDIGKNIDTVTMYVSPKVSETMLGDFLKLKPCRVIFNPGSENPTLMQALRASGFNVMKACTLVLLRTGSF